MFGLSENSVSSDTGTIMIILVVVGVVLLAGAIYLRSQYFKNTVESQNIYCDPNTGVCRRTGEDPTDEMIQDEQNKMNQELATEHETKTLETMLVEERIPS